MLAVAQGLVRRPRLLMLDEPSAGLSPVLVDRVLNVIDQLRKQGTAVLLVEQLLEKALAAADRVYALVAGQHRAASADQREQPAAAARARLFRAREPRVGDGLKPSAKDIDLVVPGWSEGRANRALNPGMTRWPDASSLLLRLADRRGDVCHHGDRRQRADRVLAVFSADHFRVRMGARRHGRRVLLRLCGIGCRQSADRAHDGPFRSARGDGSSALR